MEIDEIINKVREIFIDVLDEDDVEVAYETTAEDIDDWDSLTHIQLVVAIEKSFQIKFTSGEIQQFNNVGEMCEAIKQKLTN